MKLNELIKFAKSYQDMGSAIQDQMEVALDGNADEENFNPNAWGDISDWLNEVATSDDEELADEAMDAGAAAEMQLQSRGVL